MKWWHWLLGALALVLVWRWWSRAPASPDNSRLMLLPGTVPGYLPPAPSKRSMRGEG